MRSATLFMVVGSLLSGCATQGVNTASYTPPTPQTVKNEKTIPRRQAAVWDELVRELSKSFYVINNIERESRIINVSFNSNSPGDFVDCGRTHRTYAEGAVKEAVDYAVADSSRFKLAGNRQPAPALKSYALVSRQTSLEGRANIYVAPEAADPNKTVVSVNSRYVLSVLVRRDGLVEHFNGNIVRREPLPNESFSFIFNTNKPSTTVPEGGQSITCSGKGRLEIDILDMVK
ncbi:MAG TPA: hypothetical protein VJV79_30680 [Polyangiaceae bacterium]|nr:hypothetical protein [Polyangiaceae bacterium]